MSRHTDWICTRCNDLRFHEPAVGSWQPAKFLVWRKEHEAMIASPITCNKGYHVSGFYIIHERGIWCSTGGHGWGKWDEETEVLVGRHCDMRWNNGIPDNYHCPGIWVAVNRIMGWKERDDWCRCGKPAVAQSDGDGIYYGHYCDTCWALPEFDHIRNHRHDYLDAGEYLEPEDY
jgi:hypothetical protein